MPGIIDFLGMAFWAGVNVAEKQEERQQVVEQVRQQAQLQKARHDRMAGASVATMGAFTTVFAVNRICRSIEKKKGAIEK